jgi:hypothetical protein
MCLLVTQNQNSPALSDDRLADFYSYNSDGVGVMYSEKGMLVIEKALPKNADEFISFYRSHIQGKDCAYHLRMRTHGEIDLGNCHPYEVLNRSEHGLNVWMMHNGILSTGNAKDPKKSDTWHYIVDFLRPMLKDNPAFLFHPSFAEIVSKHIGNSNKLVLMDDSGKTVTINKSEGVYWAGLWLSNEYAWSVSDTVSNAFIDDPELATAQAQEKPVLKPLKPVNNYWADGYYSDYGKSYYQGSIKTADSDYLVEAYLDDFLDMGYRDAGNISLHSVDGFAKIYGIGSFLDIADLLAHHNIPESEFIKAVEDPETATKYFPFLEIDNEYEVF